MRGRGYKRIISPTAGISSICTGRNCYIGKSSTTSTLLVTAREGVQLIKIILLVTPVVILTEKCEVVLEQ
jgi:hypothetical protein